MRILIVEDERPIAEYIESLTRECLGARIQTIRICHELGRAADYLFDRPVDLCLLDLNLNGEDGYGLLKLAAAGSFQTIVISANTDRAVEAFRYGVLDFVPKPFDRARLQEAFDRFDRNQPDHALNTLAARHGGEVRFVPVERVRFFKSAGNYVEAHLDDGTMELLDKTMTHLERVLPPRFGRIHRSYVVDENRIRSFGHVGGGNYEVHLDGGSVLPLSREHARTLRQRLDLESTDG